MNAFILVFNHSFFALTDAEGRYRIDNAARLMQPRGWNEGVSSSPQPVVVSEGGEAELDFALR
jgi:hypothetical protein